MYIEPEGNWTVVWRWPLIAVVIVLSFLVAGLQFGMQLSRCAWGGTGVRGVEGVGSMDLCCAGLQQPMVGPW